MNNDLSCHPQLRAFLQQARESPQDDAPRLILADWLTDHEDFARAEFIRLQGRLAPGLAVTTSSARREQETRCQHLLERHGGRWLGSLWRWWLTPVKWHRGLLSVLVPRQVKPAAIADVLPWIDTALFQVTGKQSLQRLVELLAHTEVNHLHLDLRMPLLEETLLDELSNLPRSGCLRTLSFDWPLGMRRHPEGELDSPEPCVRDDFLVRLLCACSLGQHLTHLGSSFPYSAQQRQVISHLGVIPIHAPHAMWMHSLPASCFKSCEVNQRASTLPTAG
jgi:uncharacterized protein (TIGR02996 family)